jgi:fido (protein-threonine AMPylation protein)
MDRSRKQKQHKRRRSSSRNQNSRPKKVRPEPSRPDQDQDLKKSPQPAAPQSSGRSRSLSLTANAVHSLSRGECVIDQAKDPVIVRLRLETAIDNDGGGKSAIVATMTDGTHFCKILVLDTMNALTPYQICGEDLVVSIEGYVTTEGCNTKYHLRPVISLTNFSILETPDSKDDLSFGDEVVFPQTQQPTRFHTGTIGTFLNQRAPFLTTEELSGSALLCETFFGEPPLTASGDDTKIEPAPSHSRHMENLEKVGKFLARHVAMVTLQSSTTRSSDTTGTSSTAPPDTPSKPLTEHAVQNYNDALREFTTSQMDRQKASLGSNAGREPADRAALIGERHNAALDIASNQTKSLSPDLLRQWHEELLRDLHPDAGKFRTRMVRAGHTRFAPPDRIETELTLLCNSLQSLEQRLDLSDATHAVLFASIAMYGVVDIHPFLDGNGRLSRIVANWALRKLPFPINIFATPAQRSEYVLAIEKTRHFLSLTRTHGQVSRDEVLESLKTTGVFSSLIRLLMDRAARSVSECNRVFEEKSCLAAEAAEARAARRARERSAQGMCIICFDEKPNIATLCCGKAVHLNCIAEWLSGNSSCPVCRSKIPAIHRRFHANQQREQRNDAETSNDDEEEEEGEDNGISTGNIRRAARDVIVRLLSTFDTTAEEEDDEDEYDDESDDPEDNTTTMSDDEDDEEDEVENPSSLPSQLPSETEPDETSSSTTSDGGENQDEDSPPQEEEEAAAPPRSQTNHCDALYCRNRRAVDCANSLCGRCCILAGQYPCSRHNG